MMVCWILPYFAFCHRFYVLLSRALFPCDDSMVCIIDDREDIWNSAPNLVTVKPYRFFSGTGDINAPPGSEQAFTHPPAIPLHENVSEVEAKDDTDGKGKNNGEDGGGPTKSSDVSEKSSSTSEKGSSVSEKGSSVSEKSSSVSEKSSSVSEKGSSVSEKSSSVSEKGSSVSEKSDAKEVSEIEEESHEINHNEKPTSHEEKCNEEEKNNEDIIVDKHEETQQNNNEVKEMDTEGKDSEKENEQANVEVSKKSNQDVVDGNHIEDHDDYLLYLEEILRRIHSSFYEVVAWNKKAEESESTTRVAPDLRHIVPELRRDVLKGTNIVFTGVIPTNTHHENSQAWKIAKQFGANVSKDLLTQKNTQGRSKRTTHVVAARPGTEKACLALRSPHVRLVNPNWLWTCAERWEWVDERLFPVEEQQDYKSRGNGTPTSSRRSTPRRQFGDEINVKNNNKRSGDVEEAVEHITDENLRIVLNPFLSFSSGEMEAMDKEVEDLMKSSDEEDNKDDEQILGSVSSSSNSTENGDSLPKIEQAPEEDVPDGKSMDISKGKAIRFSTIKQDRHEDEERPKKRRKIDFAMGDNNEESSEGDLSTDEGSSGSNSGDDDGNNMAALLEAELIG